MTGARIAVAVYLVFGVPLGAFLTVHLRGQVEDPKGGWPRTVAVWLLMDVLWLPYLAFLGLGCALEDLADE